MAVYVDDAQIPLGRMKMCHMLADTREELEGMIRAIKLPSSARIQQPGQANEHVDISMTYRAKAVKEGAVELSSRDLVKLIRRKRSGVPAPAPEPITLGVPYEVDEEAAEAIRSGGIETE